MGHTIYDEIEFISGQAPDLMLMSGTVVMLNHLEGDAKSIRPQDPFS